DRVVLHGGPGVDAAAGVHAPDLRAVLHPVRRDHARVRARKHEVTDDRRASDGGESSGTLHATSPVCASRATSSPVPSLMRVVSPALSRALDPSSAPWPVAECHVGRFTTGTKTRSP